MKKREKELRAIFLLIDLDHFFEPIARINDKFEESLSRGEAALRFDNFPDLTMGSYK